MTGGDGGAVGEMTAWTLMQATADITRAMAAGVFVSDPRTEQARAEAVIAVLDLHDEEDTPGQLRHGHWEGYGSNERWIRDEPDECPVCREPVPCRTARLLAYGYRHREGWKEEWKP